MITQIFHSMRHVSAGCKGKLVAQLFSVLTADAVRTAMPQLGVVPHDIVSS